MLEIMTNEAESSAKIIVIGVGGAGNNAGKIMRGGGFGLIINLLLGILGCFPIIDRQWIFPGLDT